MHNKNVQWFTLQSNPMHCRHLDSGVDVWNLFTLQSSGRVVVVPYITHYTLWISNCITLQRQVVVLLPPTALACSVTCPQPPAGIGSLESTSTSTLNHLLLIYLHPVTSTYLTPNPSTSNLNHLQLSIFLPHTHMQVSGSWRVLLHIEPPSTLTLSYKLGLGGLQLMFLDALKCYKQNFLFTRDFN